MSLSVVGVIAFLDLLERTSLFLKKLDQSCEVELHQLLVDTHQHGLHFQDLRLVFESETWDVLAAVQPELKVFSAGQIFSLNPNVVFRPRHNVKRCTHYCDEVLHREVLLTQDSSDLVSDLLRL